MPPGGLARRTTSRGGSVGGCKYSVYSLFIKRRGLEISDFCKKCHLWAVEAFENPGLIVLLGYMGSGKSRVGQELAQSLGLPFADLDAYIEQELGMSIPEVFRTRGEVFFRKKEHELLKGLLKSHSPGVLSLGGGTPAYAGNMDLVCRATPNTFYLQHSIPSLVGRLAHERASRPMIAHLADEELPEFIGKHLFDRVPYYARATHILPCDGKAPGELVEAIREKLV